MTPHQRHMGKDNGVLAKRQEVMQKAKAQNYIRWGTQEVRNCDPVGPRMLNHVTEQHIRLQAA